MYGSRQDFADMPEIIGRKKMTAGEKWESLSFVGKTMASIMGTVILTGSFLVAWNGLGLPLPATQAWVLQLVGEKLEPRIDSLLRSQIQGQVRAQKATEERAWGEQLKLKLELERASNMSLTERQLIEQRIKQLDVELTESVQERMRLQRQLDKLQ
jgi:hypothetical protein